MYSAKITPAPVTVLIKNIHSCLAEKVKLLLRSILVLHSCILLLKV